MTNREMNNHENAIKIFSQNTDVLEGGLFRIVKAKLSHLLYNGKMSEPITRISFERGNSVGVLLYDRATDGVVLVRQFRFPVYLGLSDDQKNSDDVEKAWLLELVAGVQEEGESAVEVGRRELLEEAGFKIKDEFHHIANVYASPGGSSERIDLFWAEIDKDSHVEEGGGLVQEGEDIQIISYPFSKVIAMMEIGEITDGKTIIAIQHIALLKAQGKL